MDLEPTKPQKPVHDVRGLYNTLQRTTAHSLNQ